MSSRGEQLHTTVDEQIAQLLALLSTADEAVLQRPCPGREKLGDGTIGAIAAATAVNYQRIGRFVATGQDMSSPAGAHHNENGFTAETDASKIHERLTGARHDLTRIAELTDEQLDRVPPKDSFRFCDGQRTLEQVLVGLLKHQDRQVQALRDALTPAR
jgi:hypothetical protein